MFSPFKCLWFQIIFQSTLVNSSPGYSLFLYTKFQPLPQNNASPTICDRCTTKLTRNGTGARTTAPKKHCKSTKDWLNILLDPIKKKKVYPAISPKLSQSHRIPQCFINEKINQLSLAIKIKLHMYDAKRMQTTMATMTYG